MKKFRQVQNLPADSILSGVAIDHTGNPGKSVVLIVVLDKDTQKLKFTCSGTLIDNDIVLIQFKGELPSYMKPHTLPDPSLRFPNSSFWMVGYGNNTPYSGGGTLRGILMPPKNLSRKANRTCCSNKAGKWEFARVIREDLCLQVPRRTGIYI